MATLVASLYGLLTLDVSQFNKGLTSAKSSMGDFGSRVKSAAANVTDLGKSITVATAPIAAGLGLAVKSAVDFDKSMTNVRAVLGKSADEMKGINAQVLKLGANSIAGPQKTAEAFYDIVGGVSDASTHMAILEASIKTAEAGAADLGGTTKALISVMNSYRFSADKASYASDVLTRTVGMGVGTMDEFASALPQVTGLANSLGISFDELGAMTAYLTTQGNSASQATTQLAAMMTSLLNPNETMKKGLQELGFTSGEAAIKQLGLVGAMQALQGTQTASTEGFAKMTGSVETLRGVTSFAGDDFVKFSETFKTGMDGATDAARKIQLESVNAQFGLLQSQLAGLGIAIGSILLPPLNEMLKLIRPVVERVAEWVQANPEAAKTILMVAGALVALGPLLMVAGTAAGALVTAIGILLTPAVLLAGAIAAIVAAAQLGYPGGIAKLFDDATQSAQKLAFLGLYVLNLAAVSARMVVDIVIQGFRNFITSIDDTIGKIREYLKQNPEVMDALMKVGLAIGILTVAYELQRAKIVIVTTVTWALAAAKAALATGAWAASAGVGALAGAMMAAIGPILAVAAAVAASIAAVNNFKDVTKEGLTSAQGTVASMSASGNLTEQQLWEQTRRSVIAEHGDNPLSDILARSLFEQLKGSMAQSGGSQDSGGRGYPGMVYDIGTGAQPERFVPDTAGTFVPNGGGGDMYIDTVTIVANDPASFEAQMRERRRQRG